MFNPRDEHILNQSLDRILSDRFGRYSKYIIQDRALPDARDGLKPVQRRILYAMYTLGLTPDKAFKKSARVVGEVIGKYHPHGDSSIYDALVRMAQEWKTNFPLVEIHGNKGSIDDDPPAAMRYTEARLSPLALEMMRNIDKETVKFTPNFDDSEIEPTVLPALVPNLLVNGALGIAAGYATDMPPHNLKEVLEGVIARIRNPHLSLRELNKIIKGPDFPTGGIVLGKSGIHEAFERGSGKIALRAKTQISPPDSKHPYIKITEIPYGVVKSRLIRQIDEIRLDTKVAGLKEVRDESDRHGIRIMVELNKESDPSKILAYLFSKTDLQVYYHYNNVVIANRAPVKLGLIGLIDAYLVHQREILLRALEYDLAKHERRLEIVKGLVKASQIIDQIIQLIKEVSGSKQAVIEALVAKHHFSQLQAQAIAELRLYRLSNTDQSLLSEEKKELTKLIHQKQELINSRSKFDEYLINLLTKLSDHFGQKRKSQIEAHIDTTKVDLEALVKHEDAYLGVTRQGYIKRVGVAEYGADQLIDYRLKENDTLVYFHQVNTADKLLVFTNLGRYIFLPLHKVEASKWQDFGKHINDFALIDPHEKVVDAIAVHDFNLHAYIVLVTRQGKGKRVRLSDFLVTRYTSPLRAINLEKDDELINARPSNGHHQVIIITKVGRAVRYAETQLTIYSPRSSGIRAVALNQDDQVASLVIGKGTDVIGLVSSRGGLKRIRIKSIEPMGRNTKGKPIFLMLKKTPHLVLDAKIVLAKTLIYVRRGEEKRIIDFKEAEITTSQTGFSLTKFKHLDDASIMHYNRLHQGSWLFSESQKDSFEADFAKAEEDLDKASQLSIDDILDSLK
ncbi:DNA topoisomerase IV subunit A [Mycoplasma sp. ATU-Cv-703]|uniref:DNA topoisomerase IV subunit A n=2 Tax=unclassified Mycoplasma TaxID=2683645 RepID=UPI0013750A4B